MFIRSFHSFAPRIFRRVYVHATPRTEPVIYLWTKYTEIPRAKLIPKQRFTCFPIILHPCGIQHILQAQVVDRPAECCMYRQDEIRNVIDIVRLTARIFLFRHGDTRLSTIPFFLYDNLICRYEMVVVVSATIAREIPICVVLLANAIMEAPFNCTLHISRRKCKVRFRFFHARTK